MILAVEWPVELVACAGGSARVLHTREISLHGMRLAGAGVPVVDAAASGPVEARVYVPGLPGPLEATVELEGAQHGAGAQISDWRFVDLPPAVAEILRQRLESRGKAPQSSMRTQSVWSDEAQGVDIRQYVAILARYWWAFPITVLLSAVVHVLLFSTAPSYSVVLKIYPVAVQELESVGTSAQPGYRQRYPYDRLTPPYLDILSSAEVCQRILERQYQFAEGEAAVTETLRAHLGWEPEQLVDAIGDLMRMAKLDVQDDGVISIEVTHPDRDLAIQVGRAWAEEFLSYDLAQHNENTQTRLAFVETRMVELRDELTALEDSLDTFRVSNRMLLATISDSTSRVSPLMTAFNRFERQIELKQNLYVTVAQEYEQLRLQLNKQMPNFRIVNYAPSLQLAQRSFFRSTAPYGVLVGVALALVLDFARRRGAGRALRAIWAPRGKRQPTRRAADQSVRRA